MEILGYFFALLIGLIMGVIGGGGSILGVPVFVYLFGMDAISATTFSLFVVGVASAFGAFSNARHGAVDFKTAILFGVPSVLAVMFQRKLVLPHLPENLINIGDVHVAKDVFILVMFAVLMLFSSIKMILGNQKIAPKTDAPQYLLLITQGIGVGMITGLIGAGGGFLIVPALVMLLNLDMKKAIGTSLLIISMNSLLGFVSSPNISAVNWTFLLIFTAISILGMLIGVKVSKKIEGNKLRHAFGWFVLLMGVFMIVKEVFFH